MSGITTIGTQAELKKAVVTEDIKDAVLKEIQKIYPTVSSNMLEMAWVTVEKSNILDTIFKQKRETEFGKYTLDELEKLVSNDLAKNNQIALEMIKRPDFKRELVNEIYNGLGVSVNLGKEGTYGKGIVLKRQLNLQQFYTASEVSKIMKEMLVIPEFARIYDPTSGSGRLFWNMPNHRMCHGVEIEGNAHSIAKALYPDAQLIQDDTTLHIHEDIFDYIVANPPFTMFWEDKNRLFKFAGYVNKILSEMAVLEIAVRSLREGGYIAIIMPTDVWITKFLDKVKFIEWFKSKITPIAKIELPSTTHEGTVWATALFIFKKGYGHWKGNIPEYDFTYQLKSFEDEEINKLVNIFKGENAIYHIIEYAESIKNQPPYLLKPVEIREITMVDYLKSAIEIRTDDVVTLDVTGEMWELDTFTLPPINLIPNGVHADLKGNALRVLYGVKWSPARRAYVDLFREYVANFDLFLNDRIVYDEQKLVKGLHSYDCIVGHSKGFEQALRKRKEWLEFQNVPFEIWVDEDSNFNWKLLFEKDGYRYKYPEIWRKWNGKFESLQSDPLYNAFIPHLGITDNWMKYLFDFQKEDVVKMALKASVIQVSQMGLGKTRASIATALLKGFDNTLIVCETRLIDIWREEFGLINLPKPLLIEYNDDIDKIPEHKFCIISMETLKSEKDRPRHERKYKRENPDINEFNYDIPSEFDFQEKVTDTMYSMGFGESDAEGIEYEPIYSANPEEEEIEKAEPETKQQEGLRALQTMPMFADNIFDKFDFVIVDEAHNLQNPTTKQTQSVWRLKPKHWQFLTGTPIKNRVKGLLSLLIIGWGEETYAMPYSKAEFLDHFMQKKEVEYEVVDSHGYIRKKKKEIEIPQIANPDDLKTLMAGKWLRRTKYEPSVASDRKFPMPVVNFIVIEPSNEERKYAKQWYDEYLRLKAEIAEAKEELKSLRAQRQWGRLIPEQLKTIEEMERELKTKIAVAVIVIGKLRAVALAPQIDWIKYDTEAGEEEYKSPLARLIHIGEKYKGGVTPRQKRVVSELVERVKKGEQCYSIVDFPEFNHLLKGWLDEKGILNEVIDGSVSMKKRTAIIDRFRKKEINVILATIGTFDVGINIPDADYCAIINPTWNWSDMEQAYSRMIRPASKGERTVDIFFLENTIETYVRQLVEMKKYNQEYVIDYGKRPPDQPWQTWTDAVQQMFKDMIKGDFVV